MRIRPALLAAALTFESVWAASLPAQADLNTLWAAYESGDQSGLSPALCASADYSRILGQVPSVVNTWKKDWKRPQALFLLELIRCGSDAPRFRFLSYARDSEDLVRRSRDFLASRPWKPGEHADDDAFEILWHRAVLAILHKGLAHGEADRYLSALSRRVSSDASGAKPGRLTDPHLLLVGALNLDLTLTPENIAYTNGQPDATLPLTQITRAVRGRINDALRAYDTAAVAEENTAEATVRKGFLLFRLGRLPDALQALDAHPSAPADDTVRYWRALFKGLVLDRLNRPDDAAAAFEAASQASPASQSPLVALVALSNRQGRRADALRWIGALQAAPDAGTDPWWTYWYGDGRLIRDLFGRLRRAAWQ